MNAAKFIEYSSVFGNSGFTRAHPGALREGQSSAVEQLDQEECGCWVKVGNSLVGSRQILECIKERGKELDNGYRKGSTDVGTKQRPGE
jgi:hypothetical protein